MNLAVFLAALSLVESGNNDLAKGRHGELGRYQIMESTWAQHTSRHHEFASIPHEAELVATKHLRWLVDNGVPNDPRDLAIAWNCGLRNYLTKRYPESTLLFASRVCLIYQTSLDALVKQPSGGTKPSSKPQQQQPKAVSQSQ